MLRFFYTPLVYLLVPFVILRLVVRGFSDRNYWYRWNERFGFINISPGGIWIHAVSVGEVQAAAPLVEALLPEDEVLVTTTTPTGSAQLKRLFPEGVKHCYAPYDLPAVVFRFINRAQPRCLIVLETEIWPNVIRCCVDRDIRVAFVNLRLSQRSFKKYFRIKGLMQLVLKQVDQFAVQSTFDATRLKDLGARSESIHVTGSIKFEVELPASLTEVAQVLRREWGQSRTVLIAGSTHEGEDDLMLEAYQRLKPRHPELLLVIVPRHPERFTAVARLAKRKRLNAALRTESNHPLTEDVDVYVGDTMGELSLMYAASDIAFVGGSLAKIGGHNILEPCALGVPVVFGPHMFNFLQISELALDRSAAIQVNDVDALVSTMDELLSDANLRFRIGEAGQNLIQENKGALQRTLSVLDKLKETEDSKLTFDS